MTETRGGLADCMLSKPHEGVCLTPLAIGSFAWSRTVPKRPGLYWVRRAVPADMAARCALPSSGYRPLLGTYEIVGVLAVTLRPKGTTRKLRWCEPGRRGARLEKGWQYRNAGQPWEGEEAGR